jgi:exopolysaccharide biosynthesis polyprenyl glycosylphosphotransferase
MDAGKSRALRRLVLIVDGGLVVLAMALAFGIHSSLRQFVGFIRELPPTEEFIGLAFTALPLWLVLIAGLGLHRALERVYSRWELIRDLLTLHAAGLLGLSMVLFLTQGAINRSLLAVFLVCSFLLMYLVRASLSRRLRYRHATSQGRAHLLLVGSPGDSMRRFVRTAQASPLPPEFVGRLGAALDGRSHAPAEEDTEEDTEGAEDAAGELPSRLGHIDDITRVLHEHPVDAVLFFPPLEQPEDVTGALEACETVGVPASFSLELAQVHHAVPRVVRVYDDDFVTYDVAPKNPALLAFKHAFDFGAALLCVIVLSPVFLLASLAILITMGRPVIFTQRRAGLRGRPFSMLKFRSMVKDADAQKDDLLASNEIAGPAFKMADDPRVTALGRFLRRSSIDELPQLLNVLTGTMSLVGPRPLPIDEQQQSHGWQRRRLSMKPGITCLWQVSGRSDVGFDEWMRLDLRYVDDWSLWLDLKILVETVPVVIFGKGAR